MKCYLKIENSCLKIQTKHPQDFFEWYKDCGRFSNSKFSTCLILKKKKKVEKYYFYDILILISQQIIE